MSTFFIIYKDESKKSKFYHYWWGLLFVYFKNAQFYTLEFIIYSYEVFMIYRYVCGSINCVYEITIL